MTRRQAIYWTRDQKTLKVESDPELGNLKLHRPLMLRPNENHIMAVICGKEVSGQFLVGAVSRTADFREVCEGEVWNPIVNVSERDVFL